MTGNFINGKWHDGGEPQPVHNPFNGQVIDVVSKATSEQLQEALEGSGRAFKTTRDLPLYKRVELLEKVSSSIEKNRDNLARTIAQEAGKPITFAYIEVDRCALTFKTAADEIKQIKGDTFPLDYIPGTKNYTAITARYPAGPVAAITPFNFPLNLVAHKVAPALGVGNTVVHKPASSTPLTAYQLAMILEEAGIVPGQYNLLNLPGRMAQPMVSHPSIKVVSFTGSAVVGWKLKREAVQKKVTLELGGNAPAIVHQDADLDFVVPRLATGAFAYAGQICISIQRILVHRPIADELIEKLTCYTKEKVKAGDPMLPDTVVGPMIDTDNADRIIQWIDDARLHGAKVLCGGDRSGNLITPTLITNVHRDMKVYKEEVFGPVATVEIYDDFPEAIDLANDTKYGLQASIFTRDIKRIWKAFSQIETGGLIVNDYPTFRIDPMPYGGVKESGCGREGLRYAMEEMTELKLLVLNNN